MSYTIPGKESIEVFAIYTARATEPLLTILNKYINMYIEFLFIRNFNFLEQTPILIF